jgi:hypothetical protein
MSTVTGFFAVPICVALLALTSCRDESIGPDPAPTSATDAGSDGTTPGDADTQIDAKPKACPPDLPGPRLVQVEPATGERYCIDSTEVTQGQYAEFRKALSGEQAQNEAAAALPEGCPSALRLVPQGVSAPPCDSTPEAFDFLGNHSDYPVACISWCAAYSYCRWAGKRLCGRLGGGALDKPDLSDAKASQWYHACSQGGETAYSYGNDFDEQRCNGIHEWAPVDEKTACRGSKPPFDQIVDLSGGLAEWQDGCILGTELGCYVQSWRQDQVESELRVADDPACSDAILSRAQGYAPDIGFRCCLDL